MEKQPDIAEAVVLSERLGDKIAVTLWWLRGTLDTFVTIDDNRSQPAAHHLIEVPEQTNPNRVFYHPFAYLVERKHGDAA